jgi:hypothetical protein
MGGTTEMPSIIAYNGNGSDDGTVPPDLNTSYNPGAKVSILPAGSMSKASADDLYACGRKR